MLAALACLAQTPARAQSCSVSSASGSYGAVDVLAGAAVDVTTTFTVNCVGLPLFTVGICVQINEGTPNSSPSIRSMANGAASAAHELYANAARTQVWGSWGYGTTSYGGGGVAYNLGLSVLGSGSHTFTLYGRFKAGQQTTPTGTYTWSSASPHIAYGYGATTCATQPAGGTANAGASSWTATVQPNCLISAANLNFGTVGIIASNIDALGSIGLQCTSNSPWAVSLDNGLNASGSQRRMRLGATGSYISYGLYVDAARSAAWQATSSPLACTSGAGTCLLGVGTGGAQIGSVYARVPPQATPAVGAYSDTVVMTVNY
ncbi:MAG: spore coat U domain-containing protein [Beijerinckiaceae bacterium]|nr:spore coat U domain-containing protein [Beijerinckiaceae bacterium]